MHDDRLKELIRLLVRPGFRLVYADDCNCARICGPDTAVTDQEVNFLADNGWLKLMPSNCGAWLSDEGRKAFLRSTDELGDGTLQITDPAPKNEKTWLYEDPAFQEPA